MGVKSWYIVVLATLLLVLGACAPKATPTPAPAPKAPAATPAAPAPAVPALSPAEAAWQKVVSEAKKEGKVTIAASGLVGDIGTRVAAAFQRKYGIKVELVSGIGAVHIERIRAEQRAGKSIADMLETGVTTMVLAKEEGLTVGMGDLPVLREKDVWSLGPPKVDAEGHLIAYRATLLPVFINTALVKPGEEPRSYRDFLGPRWRGEQISFVSPLVGSSPNIVYVATKKAGALDDDFWRRLGLKGLRIAPSLREPPLWLARGETAVSLDTSDPNIVPYLKEGVPVKALEMEEGVTVNSFASSVSLIKNGPHPNAARVFVNWWLSQEGWQVYNEAVGGMLPLRKDVPDIRPAAVKVEMKKPLIVDLSMTLEAAKIQREGTLARLLGLEK